MVTMIVTVLGVNIDTLVTEMVIGTRETVDCSANCSQSCSYIWKWVDGVHEEVLSTSSTLRPWKTGWHKCEAECSIRDNQCTTISKLVYVQEQKSKSRAYYQVVFQMLF